MNIDNIFNFDNNIKIINKDAGADFKINKQIKIMDSDIMNENFEHIENNLNSMYEKIRILESLIEYSKEYVSIEIDKSISECKKVLNEIERYDVESGDSYRNIVFVNIPFIAGDGSTADRNGTTLKTVDIFDDTIYLSSIDKTITSIESISIESSEENYCNNKDNILNNEIYRTKYILNNIAKNGVREIITLNLNSPQSINSVKLKLANCKLKNIIYVKEDNTEIISTSINSSVPANEKIKAIKLAIQSTIYKSEKIEDVSKVDEHSYEERDYKDLEEADDTYMEELYRENLQKEIKNLEEKRNG